jgi:hypothetical protein
MRNLKLHLLPNLETLCVVGLCLWSLEKAPHPFLPPSLVSLECDGDLNNEGLIRLSHENLPSLRNLILGEISVDWASLAICPPDMLMHESYPHFLNFAKPFLVRYFAMYYPKSKVSLIS